MATDGSARTERPFVHRPDAVELHQPCHALFTTGDIFPSQLLRNARTAVTVAAVGKHPRDLHQQLLVGLGARARHWLAPTIVTATGHAQGGAEVLNCKLPCHLFYHGIPFCRGSAESMPRDFFKISLCWRRLSTSFLSRMFSCSSTVRLIWIALGLAVSGWSPLRRAWRFQLISDVSETPSSSANTHTGLSLVTKRRTASCLNSRVYLFLLLLIIATFQLLGPTVHSIGGGSPENHQATNSKLEHRICVPFQLNDQH